jgi:hypothetical protein
MVMLLCVVSTETLDALLNLPWNLDVKRLICRPVGSGKDLYLEVYVVLLELMVLLAKVLESL